MKYAISTLQNVLRPAILLGYSSIIRINGRAIFQGEGGLKVTRRIGNETRETSGKTDGYEGPMESSCNECKNGSVRETRL